MDQWSINRSHYYPPMHRIAMARQWRRGLKGIFLLGLLSVCSLLGSLYMERPAIVTAVLLAMLLLYVWAFLFGLADDYRHLRIIPYFDRTVGEIHTYTSGRSLARYCLKLGEMAIAGGQPPLTAFGFNDDLRGQPLVWHSPANGLRTVKYLQSSLSSRRQEDGDSSELVRDLQRLAFALEQAKKKDISFCLLLLHGDSTSGHEWDVRKSTAF